MRFRGWVLRNARTGSAVAYDDDRILAAGAVVTRVAGVSHRPAALQDPAFGPGRPLELLPEPSNPHDPNAVAVWDAGHRHHVGYVPADLAPDIAARLRGGEHLRAVCIAEFVDRSGERRGLRLLIAPAGSSLDLG